VLEHGVRIFERPGPFDHSKLMLVDGAWCCLGSANWDARSLRLNFEFNGGGVRHRVVYAAVIPF
jgi:cardiolipin synthase